MLKINYKGNNFQVIKNLCEKHNKPTGYGYASKLCVKCIEEINQEFFKK